MIFVLPLSLPLWFLCFPSLFPNDFWASPLSFPMIFELPLSLSLWYLSFPSLFPYDSTPSPPFFPPIIFQLTALMRVCTHSKGKIYLSMRHSDISMLYVSNLF
jgi:hypothetical protein